MILCQLVRVRFGAQCYSLSACEAWFPFKALKPVRRLSRDEAPSKHILDEVQTEDCELCAVALPILLEVFSIVGGEFDAVELNQRRTIRLNQSRARAFNRARRARESHGRRLRHEAREMLRPGPR